MEKKYSNSLIDIKVNKDKKKYLSSNYNNNDSDNESDNQSESESDNENENNNDENSSKINEEVIDYVTKYIQYDDMLKKEESKIKTLKSDKQKFETKILGYLENKDKDTIVLEKSTILKQKVENKSSINIELIKSVLTKKIEDEKLIEDILNSIEQQRSVKQKTNLKRIKKGESNKKINNKQKK